GGDGGRLHPGAGGSNPACLLTFAAEVSLLFALTIALVAAPPVPRTMRVEYFHTGNAHEERFSLDPVCLDRPSAGRPDRTVDDTNLGPYFFAVRDRATYGTLYSRGFASVFGEWQTTEEAKDLDRTFAESVRFPRPDKPVQVVLKKRVKGVFREAWSLVVDPDDPAIDRTPPQGRVWAVEKNGEPADKVDLLLLGDGYTAAEMDKWHRDARRLADLL